MYNYVSQSTLNSLKLYILFAMLLVMKVYNHGWSLSEAKLQHIISQTVLCRVKFKHFFCFAFPENDCDSDKQPLLVYQGWNCIYYIICNNPPFLLKMNNCPAKLAQWVEHWTGNRRVTRSNLTHAELSGPGSASQ